MPTSSKLIEVRPIEVKKWHEKSKEESFTRPKKIQALVDPDTLRYATGLTTKDIEDLTQGDNPVNYNLDSHFDMKIPHPFWDGPMGVIKLENNTMFFDISLPMKYIHYKVMQASRYVANSMEEYDEGLWPEATHVIWDESILVEQKASKIELKNSAIVELSKLSLQRKREIILIMRGKETAGQSEAFLVPILDEIVNKDTQDFLDLLNSNKKEVSTKALVIACMERGIFRKDGHRIFHMDSPLGDSVETVTDYLMDDANQEFKLYIIGKLKD